MANNPQIPAALITQDFNALREEGIGHIARLGHKLWTDFNAHDPGITMLEVLCYAITDLGYRTTFPMHDLLAMPPGLTEKKQFFSAAEILTCNPVTPLDLRKLIIDVEGVKNAWVMKAGPNDTNICVEFYLNEHIEKFNILLGTLLVNELTPGVERIYLNETIEGLFQEIKISIEKEIYPYEKQIMGMIEKTSIGYSFAPGNYTSIVKKIIDIKEKLPACSMEGVYENLRENLGDTNLDFIKKIDTQIFVNWRIRYYEVKDRGRNARGLNGLYHILLDLEDHIDPENKLKTDEIKTEALRRLHAHRNLCEDFQNITLVGVKPISLTADLEVEEGADANQVSAQVIYRVQEFLSPQLRFYSLEEMLEKRRTYDQIFQGVILDNGFLDDTEVENAMLRRIINKSDIYQIVMDVPGVKAVRSLSMDLCKTEDRATDLSYRPDWRLDICQKAQEAADKDAHVAPYIQTITCRFKPQLEIDCVQLSFRQGNLPVPTDRREVAEKLALIRQINHRPPVGSVRDKAFKKGIYRNLNQYVSIHNDFPLVYRIGKGQMPGSASGERKGQAKQLKAYLSIFDQILANYLAQLGHVRELLSISQSPTDRTHFYMSLRNLTPDFESLLWSFYQVNDHLVEVLKEKLPDEAIDKLLPLRSRQMMLKDDFLRAISEAVQIDEIPTDLSALILEHGLVRDYYEQQLGRLVENELSRFNTHNAILDHLIARFGEKFADYALSVYTSSQSDICKANRVDTKKKLLECKTDFLTQIPVIGRERGKAFNLRGDDLGRPKLFWGSDNVSGLEKRISKLLCLPADRRTRLTCVPEIEIIKISDEDKKSYRFAVVDKNKNANETGIGIYLKSVKEYNRRADAKKDQNQILQLLLQAGAQYVDGDPLKVEKINLKGGDIYRLVLKNKQGVIVAASSSYDSEERANEARDTLWKKIFPPNCNNEGFHIIEHILLRPFAEDIPALENFETGPNCSSGDPYSFWMSVITSKSWKRFATPEARKFFEQTVRRETPAHMGVNFLCLDSEQLYDFENAYFNWLYDEGRRYSDECQIEESLKAFIVVFNRLLQDARCTDSNTLNLEAHETST